MDLLQISVEHGYLDLVKRLVEELHVDVNSHDAEAFTTAIKKGNVRLMDYLLHHGVDLHADKESSFIDFLTDAVKAHQFGALRYLVEETKLGKYQNKLDETFLQAVRNRNLQAVEYLLDRGADLHSNNEAALVMALGTHNDEMINLLIERGGDYELAKQQIEVNNENIQPKNKINALHGGKRKTRKTRKQRSKRRAS